MYRVAFSLLLFAAFVVSMGSVVRAQDDATSGSATCNFDEDKQLVVEYQRVPMNPKKPSALQLPYGKVWAPGGKAMTLFTNAPVQLGSVFLPTGAYTMFVIPTAKQWTLIVSKSTDVSGAYDEGKDLVRVVLDSGELPSAEPAFRVSFAHIAAKQCNIRIDWDKFGHFTDFRE
jgi:hypothetical protein